MANRFWVGVAGEWNNTNTANWSTGSGEWCEPSGS